MNRFSEEEQLREVRSHYRLLLASCLEYTTHAEQGLIKKAFREVLDTFSDKREENGEPFFLHALSVARIVAEEMELDAVSIVAALLQDIPGHAPEKLHELEKSYGKKTFAIVNNLRKISDLRMQKVTINPENFIQLLLIISTDIRVILVRLADRLNLMRNIHLLSHDMQLQVSRETSGLYAPLAHRLGLYRIKQELDESAMKHSYPEIFESISRKIEETREEQGIYFRLFIEPIEKELHSNGLDSEIKYRTKSIPSIWNKMKKQNIEFEQVYDFFAIRILLNSSPTSEKPDCWKAYSLVTNIYQPNPARMRDWISAPKANGYESLHTTVIGPRGKWVEVQIRTRRMDIAAEKGRAAHWKYKEHPSAKTVTNEQWLARIRSVLENYTPGEDEIDSTSKPEAFADYIYAYTPQGDLRKLKAGATALDFAFDIHTEIGQRSSGAKVNNLYVPLKQVLKTGDQVEIITSKNQKPNKDWLTFVTTAKAITKIKRCLKDEEFSHADTGKGILQRKLNQLKTAYTDEVANRLVNYYKADSVLDMFHGFVEGTYDIQKVRDALRPVQKPEEPRAAEKPFTRVEPRQEKKAPVKALVIINDHTPLKDVKFAKCCNPVSGDEIFGFITVTEGIKIHRTDCTNAPQMHSRYAYRIVKARWVEGAEMSAYVATLKIIGDDNAGILSSISELLTRELNTTIRSVNLSSHHGKFDGTISVNVDGKPHLDLILARLSKLRGIKRVIRLH